MATFLTDEEKQKLKKSAGFLYPLVEFYLKSIFREEIKPQPDPNDTDTRYRQLAVPVRDFFSRLETAGGELVYRVYEAGLTHVPSCKFKVLRQRVLFFTYQNNGYVDETNNVEMLMRKYAKRELVKERSNYPAGMNNTLVLFDNDLVEIYKSVQELYGSTVRLYEVDNTMF